MRQFFLLGCAAIVLAGCAKSQEAPADRGVCWHAVQGKDGKIRFNKLADNVPSIEYCAAALERMRVKFLGLGGTASEITGAYQSWYIFIDKTGVSTAPSLTAATQTLLVRTGDGRLAVPGAMPQQPDAPALPQSHTINVPPPPPER